MQQVEATLRFLAAFTALFVEGIAVLFIFTGAIETIVLVVGQTTGLLAREPGWRREMFVHFGRWLVLGLEFALAADIVRTVISPSWNDIGQLAAIAVIRTFLNYFLERDLEAVSSGSDGAKAAPPL
jgi:uncharacterized membrane protein